jgi:hypothetical protein
MSIVAAARREINAVDPDQPISNIRTMEDLLDEEIGQRRLGMMLLAAFAALEPCRLPQSESTACFHISSFSIRKR